MSEEKIDETFEEQAERLLVEQDPVEEEKTEEEFVTFGKSWEDLESEMAPGAEDETEIAKATGQGFRLSAEEIAEFAYDASLNFRFVVEDFEKAGEEVKSFDEFSDEEKKEWTEVARLALRSQTAPEEDFARTLHSRISMGLLKEGVAFDERFETRTGDGSIFASPLVAPWECLPPERQVPLLVFKAVVKQFFRVWDNDNELLKR